MPCSLCSILDFEPFASARRVENSPSDISDDNVRFVLEKGQVGRVLAGGTTKPTAVSNCTSETEMFVVGNILCAEPSVILAIKVFNDLEITIVCKLSNQRNVVICLGRKSWRPVGAVVDDKVAIVLHNCPPTITERDNGVILFITTKGKAAWLERDSRDAGWDGAFLSRGSRGCRRGCRRGCNCCSVSSSYRLSGGVLGDSFGDRCGLFWCGRGDKATNNARGK